MEPTLESKKIELEYQQVGDAKGRKQTMNDVKKDAKNEEIVAFANLMGELAPADEGMEGLVLVEKSRFQI